MPFELKPLANPIRVTPEGGVYAGGTRMPFAQIIGDYTRGNSVDAIAEMYSGFPLEDLCGAIAYYLQHREDCDRWVKEWNDEADRIENEMRERFPQPPHLQERFRRFREERVSRDQVVLSSAS